MLGSAGVALTGGCSAVRFGASRTDAPPEYDPAWQTTVPVSASETVLAGDTLIAYGGNLAVVETTGERRWYTETEGRVVGVPAVSDDRVVVATRREEGVRLHAFDRTGDRQWTATARNFRSATPVVVGDRVVYSAGAPAHLIARRATDGTVVTDRVAPPVQFPLVTHTDGVTAATDGGLLVRHTTEGVRWVRETGPSGDLTRLPSGDEPTGPVVPVGNRDGTTVGLDTATGTRVWTHDAQSDRAIYPVFVGPSVTVRPVTVPRTDEATFELTGLDTATGRVRWQTRLSANHLHHGQPLPDTPLVAVERLDTVGYRDDRGRESTYGVVDPATGDARPVREFPVAQREAYRFTSFAFGDALYTVAGLTDTTRVYAFE